MGYSSKSKDSNSSNFRLVFKPSEEKLYPIYKKTKNKYGCRCEELVMMVSTTNVEKIDEKGKIVVTQRTHCILVPIDD